MYTLFDKEGKEVQVKYKKDYLEMLAQKDGYYSKEPRDEVGIEAYIEDASDEDVEEDNTLEEAPKPRRGRKPKSEQE